MSFRRRRYRGVAEIRWSPLGDKLKTTISNQFVSNFCEWATRMGYPLRVRRRLPTALRKLPEVFAKRDNNFDLVQRTLDRPAKLGVNVLTSTCWMYVSDHRLVLGGVGPSWRGIRDNFSDADIGDLIDGFSFLASQYAYRSNMMRLIGGLVLAYNTVCDFRTADSLQRIIVGPGSPYSTMESARETLRSDLPISKTRCSRRSRELEWWVKKLNPFDPLIHRAVFQFWRAIALWMKGFSEEAIAALDSVTTVASEAVQLWHLCAQQPERKDVGNCLGMSGRESAQLERLYLLRCSFGAHPSVSKWWDFHEMYEDELEEYFDLQRRLLRKLVILEAIHRRVDPEPREWSTWFVNNSEMLLDAVWFARVP